jgi:hypothetical protein
MLTESGFLESLLHRAGGDFVKHDAEEGGLTGLLRFQFFLQVKADGFAFAIRIGREIDVIDALAACFSSAISFFLPSITS